MSPMFILKIFLMMFMSTTGNSREETQIQSGRSGVLIRRTRDASDCSLGEVLRICRPSCEATCSNMRPSCGLVCSPASCVCTSGFVRHAGICIPHTACRLFRNPQKSKQIKPNIVSNRNPVKPSKSLTSKTPKQQPLRRSSAAPVKKPLATPPPDIIIKPARPPPNCGKGQHFTLCVCDASCDGDKICLSCSSGCGCFPHHVRNEEDDQCIPFNTCPQPRLAKMPRAIIDLPSFDESSQFHSFDTRTARKARNTPTKEKLPKSKDTLKTRLSKEKNQQRKPIRLDGAKLQPPTGGEVIKMRAARGLQDGLNRVGPPAARKDHGTGPVPPSFPWRSSTSFSDHGAPSATPKTTSGPPSITPFVFFRQRRLARRRKAIESLRLRLQNL